MYMASWGCRSNLVHSLYILVYRSSKGKSFNCKTTKQNNIKTKTINVIQHKIHDNKQKIYNYICAINHK
jgi:hypothetical protein